MTLTLIVAISSWIVRESEFSWILQNGDNISWLMAATIGGVLQTIGGRSMVLLSIAVILPLTLPQSNLGTDTALLALAIATLGRLLYYLDQRVHQHKTEQQES